mgnify:CR=1 FL=1
MDIPLEVMRSEIKECVGNHCDADSIISECIAKVEKEMLALKNGDEENINMTDAVNKYLHTQYAKMEKETETYDISEFDDLLKYESGDKVEPELWESVVDSIKVYNNATEKEAYSELMAKTYEERCAFLIKHRRGLLFSLEEWEKIFDNIKQTPEAYARYYPMVMFRLDDELTYMVSAFATNDELYSDAMKAAGLFKS